MSSIAKTTGRSRLAASTSVRTAENRRARTCWGSSESALSANSSGTSMPSGRASVAARRSGESSSPSTQWSAQKLFEAGAQAGERDFGLVGVGDAELVADDLAERPVGEARAVGRAVADPHERRAGPLGHRARELAKEPALADAGLAHDGHEVRALLPRHAVEHRREELGLVLAADERGGRARERGARDRHADRLPCRDGLGLALEVERLELHVLDGGARKAVGRLADRDRAGLGGRLKAGGNVHRVPDHGVAVAHLAGEYLARVDSDPEGEVDAGDLLVDLVHGALHGDAGAHRALGVVLVSDGRAEDGHYVVADELVDGPAESCHLLAKPLEGTIHHRLESLGVHALGDRGVAGEIGEQNGRHAALLRPGLRSGE